MVTTLWDIQCTFSLTQNQAVIASMLWPALPWSFQPAWTDTHHALAADLTLWIFVIRNTIAEAKHIS